MQLRRTPMSRLEIKRHVLDDAAIILAAQGLIFVATQTPLRQPAPIVYPAAPT